MDIDVERQFVEQLAAGDKNKFLMLYDAYFGDLYRYVSRRIFDNQEVERIVRLTLLEALGQSEKVPGDVGFVVWLYSLAKPRVWKVLDKGGAAALGDVCDFEEGSEEEGLVVKVEKMFDKLGLEEREILRLKFFEEVSDGDVMTILGTDQETIGARIYKVLKRVHFLLFGDSDAGQGVYFGELSGMLSQIRGIEKIEVPEAVKIGFKADLSGKIDSNTMVVEEIENEKLAEAEAQAVRESLLKNATGSKDPAKVFVEAANELTNEEKEVKYDEFRQKKQLEEMAEDRKEQKREEFLEAFDRWRGVLVLIPVFIFLLIIGVFTFTMLDFGSLFSKCKIDVAYVGELTEDEIKDIDKKVNNRICKEFNVTAMQVRKVDDDMLKIWVDDEEWFLKYRFETRNTDNWYVQKFEKDINSDRESWKVLRDQRDA